MDGKPAYKNLLKEELKARRQHLMVPYHRRARAGGGVLSIELKQQVLVILPATVQVKR